MRGTLRESRCHRPRGDSPSPQPSPRKRGEGAHRHRGVTPARSRWPGRPPGPIPTRSRHRARCR
ncbi:hypothetical protein E4K64_06750 [Bradyrhizobium frederickii]|uniref:Uncharacterized protein n=1 Tax=Bradyrhizobium frederickii TaxID=2560054 RepID=A0A4Y9PIM6_9BRAD|nr:hypothetical protein E4K64_06750 [Bradyrhizobium frederickii]